MYFFFFLIWDLSVAALLYSPFWIEMSLDELSSFMDAEAESHLMF